MPSEPRASTDSSYCPGGPSTLALIPTSEPSAAARCPAELEVSSKPGQVVGADAPVNVGLPLMFGDPALENRLLVSVPRVEMSFPVGQPTLFSKTVPLPRTQPVHPLPDL